MAAHQGVMAVAEPPRRSAFMPIVVLLTGMAVGLWFWGGGLWALVVTGALTTLVLLAMERRYHDPPQVGGGDRTSRRVAPHAHLQELVNHLATAEPQRLERFLAIALRPDQLNVPQRRGLGAGRAWRAPFGSVTLYSEYLLFTTTRQATPDRLDFSLGMAVDVLRNYRARLSLVRLAKEAYVQLRSTSELDQLRGPLANPASLVVPLSTVRSVRRRQEFGIAWIELDTTDGRILIGSHPWPELLSFSWIRNGLAGCAVLAWQPRFYDRLRDAVATRSAPQRPDLGTTSDPSSDPD